MIQRGGQVVLHMLANVQQITIKPIIEAVVMKGSLLYTDEYNIYDRLSLWGYRHQSVCHSRGEYARDEDGDSFHEIHVNTMEGFWSLLRSWLRPHRGISQENCRSILGFSNSFTTPAKEANSYSQRSSVHWSHDRRTTTPKPRMSLVGGTEMPPARESPYYARVVEGCL